MQLADEHFKLLVDSVQDYAIYLLGPDGTIQSWNAGAQRLKGYEHDEIVGQSFARFFSDGDREAGRPAQLIATALRDGRVEDIGWRVRKDGSQFWASAVITTLRDATGKHIGFAKVTRDLTDRAYRAFVETTHSIVWTTDGNGQPNSDSASWRDFTGQTEAQWRGLHAWEPVHPDDVEALRAAWANAKASGTRFESEFRLRRHDGEYVWMAVRATPFFDNKRRVREWFGVTYDISDRKLAELQRERALEMWRTTLRSIGDAVIATDVRGNVRFLNPVAEQLTGWAADEALGCRLRDVFPIFNEESGAPVENPVDKVLREGVIVGLANHTVLRRRDGQETPIDDSAAPIRDPDGSIEGVVLVFRDASEEKREIMRRAFLARATEELVRADDYAHALQRVAELAVPRLADWVGVSIGEPGTTETQQVAIAHVDPAKIELARMLNLRYPPDPGAPTGVPNVMRTGRSELYPEIPRELLLRGARDAEHLRILEELDLRSAIIVPLRGKGPVFGAITFIHTGSRRYTERDLALAEELAARAALISERRRLAEEAEQANRMKDEFLATMSHELRTPLQAIVGYASMLERGIARDPAKALAAIVRNAAAQARLVEDILDISGIATGKLRLRMARVDLGAAIRAALESVRPSAITRRIQIDEHVPSDLGYVHGDFERLQQIVWNLLSNAVKFSEPDSVVELRAEATPSSVQITVRDSGKGIAREHLGVIFERFRQLDSSTTRRHGGLGLGLAIVRYLAEAHGGTVTADSAGPGTGATFTLTLPRRAAALDQSASDRETSLFGGVQPLRGLRVMLVEDDNDARELLAQLMTEAGASVTRASSAAEAFELLQVEPPQVLISDIGMPDEDGMSLLRRVRALPPERGGDVPAIALTAYARPEDVRAAIDAGFQLHLVKPVEVLALIDAVRAWSTPRFAAG